MSGAARDQQTPPEPESEFRMVSISRAHLDEILASYGPDVADSRARLEALWMQAPESAWDEIADEFCHHRCRDANCFAESVLTRLGAIRFNGWPFPVGAPTTPPDDEGEATPDA